MAKRKRVDSAAGVLGYFDKDLAVRRRLFADTVTICDLETPDPAEVSPADRAVLRCGQATVCLSGVLNWVEGVVARCSTFYVHHHDNIATEVALCEPYARESFLRCLPWFRTRPADEGGTNLLGSVGRGWLLLLVNDNQGRFQFEFFGPAESCDTLRKHLGQHNPVTQPDRQSGGRSPDSPFHDPSPELATPTPAAACCRQARGFDRGSWCRRWRLEGSSSVPILILSPASPRKARLCGGLPILSLQ